MIPRYEKKEISQIWTEENKFKKFLQVEIELLKALESEKMIPNKTSDAFDHVTINLSRIHEIEKTTRHDVIAFCSSITEQVDPNVSKYFHYGVTSSDVIDTALSLQVRESLDLILLSFEKLLKTLKEKAEQHTNTLTIGRSHGMYAEPMSFSQKLMGHYYEFERRYQDLKDFYDRELTAQFSGAVGNYTILTKDVEKKAAQALGLKVEDCSTQVIPRDRLAKLISITALYGAALERLCIEIRHLHRSDVGEIHEGFSKGQKGSSTMPHKKNPISGENLSGIARILRSHIHIALENTLLWHERDISHSSAERMYLPDAMGLVLYSLERLESTIENLVVHTDKMEERVKENFTYLSSFYLHKIIDQTDLTREEIYPIVQKASFGAKGAEDFHKMIKEAIPSLELKLPTFEEIKKIFLANN